MNYIVILGIGAIIPIMSNFLYSKVLQFNELRKLVSTDNHSFNCSSIGEFISSIGKSISILKSSAEVMFNQKLFSPLKVDLMSGSPKTSKFVYIYHNMKWYKVPFVINRGPLQREITTIKDEYGADITKDIIPFAGPNNDFFGTGISPHFFGLNKMTIISEGEEYEFFGETPIIFSLENLFENRSNDKFILPTESVTVISQLSLIRDDDKVLKSLENVPCNKIVENLTLSPTDSLSLNRDPVHFNFSVPEPPRLSSYRHNSPEPPRPSTPLHPSEIYSCTPL